MGKHASSHGSTSRGRPRKTTSQLNVQMIESAQQTLQWLYHVLTNLGMKTEVEIWARMALPEVPGNERVNLYCYVAKKADSEMFRRGQREYFMMPDVRKMVEPLLSNGYGVLPEEADFASRPPPPLPDKLGVMRPQNADSQPPKSSINAPPPPSVPIPSVLQPHLPKQTQPPSQQYQRHLPTPYNSPRIGQIAAPAADRSTTQARSSPRPSPVAAVSRVSASGPPGGAPGSSAPVEGWPHIPANHQRQIRPTPRLLSNHCLLCGGNDHPTSDCTADATEEQLRRLHSEVISLPTRDEQAKRDKVSFVRLESASDSSSKHWRAYTR